MRAPVLRAAATLVMVLGLGASAAAQPQTQMRVRVLSDRTTIWRLDAHVPATTVKAGTILDVVSQEPGWYIVLIPPEYGGSGETGMIAASAVEVASGASPPTEPRRVPPRPAAPPRRPARPIEVFGSGQVGFSAWLAHQTFAAVLDHSVAPIFGGAIEVHVHERLFVEGAVDFFQHKGQRVFVSDGAVFKLGIQDTVRIIPVSVTVGYRHPYRTATAYVGGGTGTYFYRETSDFADSSENVDEQFTSFHGVAGVEFGGHQRWRTAFEVQFTTVPNALGTHGASSVLGEQNLGGVQVRVKVLGGG